MLQKTRKCVDCLKEMGLENFNSFVQRGFTVYRTECKPCHSRRVVQKQQEKKIEKYPDLYIQCENEDCNYIWHKRRGELCPKCFRETILENM